MDFVPLEEPLKLLVYDVYNTSHGALVVNSLCCVSSGWVCRSVVACGLGVAGWRWLETAGDGWRRLETGGDGRRREETARDRGDGGDGGDGSRPGQRVKRPEIASKASEGQIHFHFVRSVVSEMTGPQNAFIVNP